MYFMKYNADDIIVNKRAESKQTSDGKLHRIWDIVLKKIIPETNNLEDISRELSHDNFNVHIRVTAGKHLTVSVTNEKSYWDDEFLFSTYRMFEDIERLLGTIDTIQGQKNEDRWSPYKKNRISENQS
ncbi:hypothetical protein RIVM261_085030 [Rivularia sp. IAM M-261]|nr:hypothetical protein CAL7716_090620 [Calothrix sp. PCC 7716]GJD23547.1 hypothetical protein RIVM261_085030 [Rivularia sp. IAM M-261]